MTLAGTRPGPEYISWDRQTDGSLPHCASLGRDRSVKQPLFNTWVINIYFYLFFLYIFFSAYSTHIPILSPIYLVHDTLYFHTFPRDFFFYLFSRAFLCIYFISIPLYHLIFHTFTLSDVPSTYFFQSFYSSNTFYSRFTFFETFHFLQFSADFPIYNSLTSILRAQESVGCGFSWPTLQSLWEDGRCPASTPVETVISHTLTDPIAGDSP